VAFRQCGFNHFLFLPNNHFLFLPKQCTAKGNFCTSDFERLSLEPRLVHRKSISVAQDDAPFNYIL